MTEKIYKVYGISQWQNKHYRERDEGNNIELNIQKIKEQQQWKHWEKSIDRNNQQRPEASKYHQDHQGDEQQDHQG